MHYLHLRPIASPQPQHGIAAETEDRDGAIAQGQMTAEGDRLFHLLNRGLEWSGLAASRACAD